MLYLYPPRGALNRRVEPPPPVNPWHVATMFALLVADFVALYLITTGALWLLEAVSK